MKSTFIGLVMEDGQAPGFVPSRRDAIWAAEEPSVTTLTGEDLPEGQTGGFVGAKKSSIGQPTMEMSLRTHLRGGGNYGAATPLWNARLLRVCGMSQEISKVFRATTFRQPSFMRETGVMSWVSHGNEFAAKGTRFLGRRVRGEWTLMFEGGKYPELQANLKGQWERPESSQPQISENFPDYVGGLSVVGLLSRASLSIVLDNGRELDIKSFMLEVSGNNTVTPDEGMDADGGFVDNVGDRGDITGRIQVQFPDEQREEWYRMATERGHFGLRLLLGNDAGDVIGFRANQIQPMVGLNIADRNTRRIIEVPIKFITSGEASEYELTFFEQSREELEDAAERHIANVAAGGVVVPADEFAAGWVGAAQVYEDPPRPALIYSVDTTENALSSPEAYLDATVRDSYVTIPAPDYNYAGRVFEGNTAANLPNAGEGVDGDFVLVGVQLTQKVNGVWAAYQDEDHLNAHFWDATNSAFYSSGENGEFAAVAGARYAADGFGVSAEFTPAAEVPKTKVVIVSYPVVNGYRIHQLRKVGEVTDAGVIVARGDVLDTNGQTVENVVFELNAALVAATNYEVVG